MSLFALCEFVSESVTLSLHVQFVGISVAICRYVWWKFCCPYWDNLVCSLLFMYCWKWICVAWKHRLVTHLCNNAMQATLIATSCSAGPFASFLFLLFIRGRLLFGLHLDRLHMHPMRSVTIFLYLWIGFCDAVAIFCFYWKRKLYRGSSLSSTRLSITFLVQYSCVGVVQWGD
jgi:hypothetical protein